MSSRIAPSHESVDSTLQHELPGSAVLATQPWLQHTTIALLPHFDQTNRLGSLSDAGLESVQRAETGSSAHMTSTQALKPVSKRKRGPPNAIAPTKEDAERELQMFLISERGKSVMPGDTGVAAAQLSLETVFKT